MGSMMDRTCIVRIGYFWMKRANNNSSASVHRDREAVAAAQVHVKEDEDDKSNAKDRDMDNYANTHAAEAMPCLM